MAYRYTPFYSARSSQLSPIWVSMQAGKYLSPSKSRRDIDHAVVTVVVFSDGLPI